MPSAIEVALYGEAWSARVSPTGEVGEHCLLRIELAEETIRLRVAPFDRRFAEWTDAAFERAELVAFAENATDPDDLRMPWDIVGFHCRSVGADRWEFSLNGHYTRWRWISAWPRIERGRT